jgi:hypothetical protein
MASPRGSCALSTYRRRYRRSRKSGCRYRKRDAPGRSTDPNEFLDKAAYHYVIARELGEEYTREEIDQKIARALAQAERGETVDGEEFFEKLRLRGEQLNRGA